MQKIKCVTQYDGTHFAGFQIQPEQRTVQGEIEKALQVIHKGEALTLQVAGRTDRGVHAQGQVFQFETPLDLPPKSWVRALNALVPGDIQVLQAEVVPRDFHVRYHARAREYRYYILHDPVDDVFKRNYYYHVAHPLNLANMQAACAYFEGEHDFTTFSSAKATVKGSRVRELTHVSCEKQGNEIEIILKGNGFLYNMVRIIVGCLLDVGQGKFAPTDIPRLIAGKDRQLAGKTAPPQGLYLWDVRYE